MDQNTSMLDQHFAPQQATAAQFGQSNANYAFNQPVTATGNFTPGQRAALNQTGFFGGVMARTANPSASSSSPYVLTGGYSGSNRPRIQSRTCEFCRRQSVHAEPERH
ncbi:MAG: hypothetical protein JO213_14080 [Alphaproteobacteria bacterium]|nr:hypothetical protein [Alphaproteobacteria bacterium]MBV9964360.1 hypothetical protein [Alphaproteobacteria bacterium]